MTQITPEPVEAAHAALAKREWRDAYEHFVVADRTGAGLAVSDLRGFAEAAWWTGHVDDCERVQERAYAMSVEAGDRRTAAFLALELMRQNGQRRATSVAGGWFASAERLLEGDTECASYAYLRFYRALSALDRGELDGALVESRAALDLATRLGERDAQALALTAQGLAFVAKGQVDEGMGLLDEATVAAVSGEISLFITGWIYCMTIKTCRDLGDYRRAGEWTDAARRWCDRMAVSGFPGVCRVHRAEVLALRGTFAEAEQEARRACEELTHYGLLTVVADAFYEIGEIRTRMGDLPAAEEAYGQAREMGHRAEPGLSRLRLAQGKAEAANASLRRILADEPRKPERGRLLPAQVEAAIATGDLETARAAVTELDEVATSLKGNVLQAHARLARGRLTLAEGDPLSAERVLRRAWQLWQDVDAPYESATTRVLIAEAVDENGDAETARIERQGALATFERIGASRDAHRVREMLGESPRAGAPAGVLDRVTRTFFFSDVVSSTSLIGVIGDDAWQHLIRWHDDTLRSIIAEHGGEEIRHQGDGLFISFADAGRAVDCAIAIQRRLEEHRRTHGFAPQVRIGLHIAEASRRGLDYAGVGVHEAARIAALAGAGEIIASTATVAAVGRALATEGARTVALKGIEQSVEVASIAWR